MTYYYVGEKTVKGQTYTDYDIVCDRCQRKGKVPPTDWYPSSMWTGVAYFSRRAHHHIDLCPKCALLYKAGKLDLEDITKKRKRGDWGQTKATKPSNRASKLKEA